MHNFNCLVDYRPRRCYKSVYTRVRGKVVGAVTRGDSPYSSRSPAVQSVLDESLVVYVLFLRVNVLFFAFLCGLFEL